MKTRGRMKKTDLIVVGAALVLAVCLANVGYSASVGDGSEESHTRMQAALDYLWPYVGEMFRADAVDAEMAAAGIGPDPSGLREEFDSIVTRVLAEATLEIPASSFGHKGGKDGSFHTEHLGHLLSTMQWLQRAYPGCEW